jgi:hypothetical protein
MENLGNSRYRYRHRHSEKIITSLQDTVYTCISQKLTDSGKHRCFVFCNNLSVVTDNTSHPHWVTVWHAFCSMGTSHYEFKQFYFIFMHSTSSDWFQLIAFVLMQIPCWMIRGSRVLCGWWRRNRIREWKLWPSCINSYDHIVLSSFEGILKNLQCTLFSYVQFMQFHPLWLLFGIQLPHKLRSTSIGIFGLPIIEATVSSQV